MKPSRIRRPIVLITVLLALPIRAARAEAPVPTALQGVDVIEHLGAQVPLDLSFVDSWKRAVKLGDYFHRDRPLLLTLVYYECPMLCSLVLNGAIESLKQIDWKIGRDYDAVTVSFDPSDKPELAAAKRRNYLQALGVSDERSDWPFLTGGPAEIRALTDSVGFRYNALPATRQFAHSAVVFVLTPRGAISRYLYGIQFPSRDLRLALGEAAAGRSGPSVDRILLSCFRYDPATRRYHFFIYGFIRTGGMLVFFALLGLLFWGWRLELRRSRAEAARAAAATAAAERERARRSP